MIIKQASDLHFTYVENTPDLREAFIAKCNEFGIGVFGLGGEKYLEVYSDGYDEFEICGTNSLEEQSKELTMADLTDIPTETPEEKEVLDGIESAGEFEWNGEGLPPVGAIYTLDPNYDIELLCKYSSEYVVVGEMLPEETYRGMEVIVDTMTQRDRTFRKPETPQQREDRERLESAYDLYEESQRAIGCIVYDDFDSFKKPYIQVKFWLAIVDKTNYRKEKTHGTN